MADPRIDAAALGATLRAIRERRGLTQTQLAERSGVPQPHLSGYETGARPVTLDAVLRIAGALGWAPVMRALREAVG